MERRLTGSSSSQAAGKHSQQIMGLRRKLSIPIAKHRCLAPSVAEAVRAIMVGLPYFSGCALISLQARRRMILGFLTLVMFWSVPKRYTHRTF